MTSTPVASDTTKELRVAAKTPTAELASAISHAIYDGQKVVLRAIGAAAVNQVVKALVVAQGYAAQRGLVLANRPGFVTAVLDGEERTAIIFNVFTV
jgi:stage V sporulation protein S